MVSRGLRVGLVTNDQGSHLLDTEYLRRKGFYPEEIAGGCFCCRFEELVTRLDRILTDAHPNVILAEAVGSCTDLSATVYQPLRKYFSERFELAPLSIFVEPQRWRAFSLGGSQFDESVAYLFQKQLAEGDVIVLNKADLLREAERQQITDNIMEVVADIPVLGMSALSGVGVSDWVDHLLGVNAAGGRVPELDYRVYAEAEASLAWLNATVDLTNEAEFSPREFGEKCLEAMRLECARRSAAIAHIKILLATSERSDRISLTDLHDAADWSGSGELGRVRGAIMVVNARVCTRPDELTAILNNSLTAAAAGCGIEWRIQVFESFAPQPPQPRFRFDRPVMTAD